MGACWVELCGKRGLPLNSDKRQRCRQRAKYAGFLFDTLRGQLPILPKKLKTLPTCPGCRAWKKIVIVVRRLPYPQTRTDI